jgi:hypothetical protein
MLSIRFLRTAAAADQYLATDVVGFGDAEHIDRARGFFGCPASAQWNGGFGRLEAVGLHADCDGAAADVHACITGRQGLMRPKATLLTLTL